MKNSTAIALMVFSIPMAACTGDPVDTADAREQVQWIGDPTTGRQLFTDKGCVICHSINGVGGKAAPPLDAATQNDVADPVGFAARMWRGAPAMIELQAMELGYSIWLEPQEMADLAAFAANAAAQKTLTLNDIDPGLAESFLDEGFWEVEDWDAFLGSGQDGAGEPPNRSNDRESL